MAFSTLRMTPTERVLSDIAAERRRQDAKWGKQVDLTPERWLTILLEEIGEAAEAALDGRLEGHYGFKEELVQVAAVAARAVETLSSPPQESK